ncbi:MAG TPA: ESX secretion-associated protein EspG, partial [Mycobacterium sp.]|nr:ESX secretion-associated protein EspG [Mycobacterium sp.]
MSLRPNAVELTVDQSWYIAETVGAGSFPWVLAITTPYRDAAQRGAFLDGQAAELARLGLVSPEGAINPAVADWIRVVCFPERWLDLRFIGSGSSADELLRGIVARRGRQTVVALRNAQLVTFTSMDINDPRELGPVLTAGLRAKPPAHFEEFRLPARVGARADERLRGGAALPEVLDYLGIPRSSRPVVESVFTGPRSYVEIVAGQRNDGQHATT